MASSRRVAVGIDLGTTNSCVAVFRNGEVNVIVNGQGSRTTPSCVSFNEEERLIGDAAKAQANVNHLNTIYQCKRLIGRKFKEKSVQNDMKNWPFKVVDASGSPKLEVTYKNAKKLLTPEEISAMVLSEMKTTAEIYLGCNVHDAVITVPAYFNDSQRQATKDAGTIAGLNVLNIINEPTAAAIAYGIDKNVTRARNVLVFDLGGGTFDVVLLTIANDEFEVKAVGGDTHLGGVDFDNRLVKYFQDYIYRHYGKDISTNMKMTGRLRNACEKAKLLLSSSIKSTLAIDGFLDGEDFIVQLTRNRFEDLCDDLFQSTLEHVKNVLREAEITVDDVEEVVLVGGSSRIPKIRELLQTFFSGKKLNQTINPDEAVAYGAAIKAALSSGERSMRELSIVDVIPLSLGLQNWKGEMIKSIKCNTRVPITHISEWTTQIDYMTTALFVVYEGENQIAKQNHLLGEFVLNNIEMARQGVPKFDVKFFVDSDGILTVTAVDRKTHCQNKIILTNNKGRLSNSDISRMMQEMKLYDKKQNDPRAKQKSAEAKEVLELYCFHQKLLINSRRIHDTVTETEREMVLEWLNETIDWIDFKEGLFEEDYRWKMLNMKSKCAPYIAKLC